MLNYTFLLLTIWFYLPTNAVAQSYYVCQACTNASDGNLGSLAAPWKTIGRSCQAGAVSPGSTIYIRAGTYTEKLTIQVTGTADQPITYRPYNDELARIDGGSAAAVLLTIQDKSYLTLDKLIFQNALGSGSNAIQVSGNARSITIRNCTITNIAFDATLTTPTNPALHNAHGILVKGDDPNNPITNLLIQGNTLDQIRPGYSEGLTLVGNIAGFAVLDNTISNVANIGLVIAGYYSWACPSCPQTATTPNQARQGTIARNQVLSCRGPLAFAAGIYADGSRDMLIEGNLVRDCQRGFQINCENPDRIAGAAASNILLRNNLAYQNSRAGLGLGSSAYSSNLGKVVSCTVVNNSLFDNFIDRAEAGAPTEDFGEVTLSYSENCILENNSFHAGNRQKLLNSYDTPASINLRFNYNLWFTTSPSPVWILFGNPYYSFVDFQRIAQQDGDGTFTNPQYVSTTTPINLNIGAGSMAINRGNPASTTALIGSTDFAQQPRLRAGRVDVGAYEFAKPVISTGSGSWHTVGSWDCNCVPTGSDQVQIQSGHNLSINGANSVAQARQLALRGRLQYLNAGRLLLSQS